MIALRDITKRYGAHEAVKGVRFTAQKGQTLGLLGMNGAGKTTTLNILTGYLAPTSGSVSIAGHDMLSEPLAAKAHLGYLPEKAPLYDEMTVAGYLRFVCGIKRVPKGEADAHIQKIAGMCGLADMLGRRVGNLSKGFRQRAGLAQALLGDPQVLALDEPTVGLDPRQTAEFRDVIRTLAKGRTVIFSSHILNEVQSLCDRVIILHHGRVICDSALSALRDDNCCRLRASIEMNADALLPALRSVKGVRRVTQLPAPDEGATEALLECDAGAQVRRELFTLLSGLRAPILRLTPVEDTLEDVFLRCTAGE